MTEPINPVRLATIRNNHAHDQRKGFLLQADNRDLGDLLEEVDRLTAENERLRAEASACTEQLDAWLKRNGGDWDGPMISYARDLLTGEDQ